MGSILSSALAFIFAIAVLIAFHEFGHYWVARRAGVKVLRYSIGFGKPIWMKRAGPDQTEYVIAAIPLGGYVKMLDEREGDVDEHEVHRAFNRQPVSKRIAIVAAGPIFNFIFAVVAYAVMYQVGVPGVKPIIGEVVSASIAAQAGLEAHDEIVAVEGEVTPTWSSVRMALLQAALDQETIKIEVQKSLLGNGLVDNRLYNGQAVTDAFAQRRTILLPVGDISTELKQSQLLQQVGVQPFRPPIPAVIGKLESGGAAERDGLLPGDRVVTVSGTSIKQWSDWVEIVRASPDEMLTVEVERGTLTQIVELTPKSMDIETGVIGRIGAMPEMITYPEELQTVVQYSIGTAIYTAVVKTWQMSVLTLRMIGKMIVGEVSVKNLSGPITIATYAGYTASEGFTTFLSFLAIVSISLGVLNLLPIPLLDGGHLLYYLIEIVKGSALSDEIQGLMQRVGIVLLGLLMMLAFYNDIQRLFSS
ncbi:MAG: RIP metalloprotease RseP [Gammaproteobacteria bacterium]|nr:RIP metalloprotease RseP [Gammaproteobacteria bacterium]